MDAFSWFRQRRQTPPGRQAPLPEDIRIPLTTMPTVGFVVYFQVPSGESPPDETEMRERVSEYIDRWALDPLREGLHSFLEQGFISLIPHDRETIPEPPDELLRAYNPGEIEERRYRNATHALYIGTTDLLLPPRVGLWASLVTAHAMTASLPGGVLMDPEFPRLMPLNEQQSDLPSEGQVHVVEHILVQVSQTRSGLLHLATSGMGRFGLPDVELREAPPNLSTSLLPVVNGVAQWLVEQSMRYTQETGDIEVEARPEYLPLRAEVPLALSDVRRAYEDVDTEEIEEEAPDASVTLRLEMSPGQRGKPSRVRILPPGEVRSGFGVWLNEVLTKLFGSDPQLAMVETGDEAMEEAHQKALEELPRVRNRFLSGFRSGEVLHVKHGFTTDQGHEYMWIAVTAWHGDRIRGSLANDPQYRNDLHAGQTVEIREEEVFDWLIVHTDGRMEGAYTNRILEEPEE